MYVLPYGQMSLWGATVITNLMSAIPWVGQDIVEFIWGGLNQLLIEEPNNSDVVQQILLIAKIPPRLVFGYVCVFTAVKKPKTWGQSAGVRGIYTIEASQRLNAENLTKFSPCFCLSSYKTKKGLEKINMIKGNMNSITRYE